MTVQGIAGQSVTLDADFYVAGALANASAIQLDITYGSVLGFGPDYAGPFTFIGAESFAPGQVWQTGTGQYAFSWSIPPGATSGDYVANWTFTFAGVEYLATENIMVAGSSTSPVPGGDTGYWTGGLIYAAAGIDLEFGAVDGTGTSWLWQKITGWDGPALQGAGVIPRSGDHGAWAAPQYYAARQMTLTCSAGSPSQTIRDEARALLQQAVPVSDLAVLRYDEPVSKCCLVRRSGQVTEACPTLADVTFTIPLVAPDMRKYSTAQKSVTVTPVPSGAGGGLVVPFTIPFTLDSAAPPALASCVNNGNFGCPPVVVISGPASAPRLANLTTGQTVSWPGVTLTAADTLTVDFLNRQAWIDAPTVPQLPGQSTGGGDYAPADISSAWWTLGPGTSLVQFGGDTSSGASAVIYHRDCWS